MPPAFDRLKKSFLDLARGAVNAYAGVFRAEILAQKSGERVDLKPADDSLPVMAGVPFHQALGVKVQMKLRDAAGRKIGDGIRAILGFEDGRPDHPFVLGVARRVLREQIAQIAIEGMRVHLGRENLDVVRDGILTGRSKDPYTGLEHWMLGNASTVVAAQKDES